MSYVYLVEFVPTGQMYIGSRWAEDARPEELFNPHYNRVTTNSQPFDGGYWTSSIYIHKLLKDHGVGAFRVVFIVECSDSVFVETQLLNANDAATSDLFLNMHNNSCEGWRPIGYRWINNGTYEKYYLTESPPEGWSFGRLPQSDEVKRKKGKRGKIWVTDGNKDTMVYPDKIPVGYVSGRSANLAGTIKKPIVCEYCGATGGAGNMERYHQQNCKLKKFRETGDTSIFRVGKLSFKKCGGCSEYHHKSIACPNCSIS